MDSQNEYFDDNQLNDAFVDRDNTQSLEKGKKNFSFNYNLEESHDFNEDAIINTEANMGSDENLQSNFVRLYRFA
jgi:hypothetical protein